AEASLVTTRAEVDFLAFILLQRAALLRDEGAVERARKDLDRADRLVRELAPGAETRQRLELELGVQRAMFRPERTTEALKALDRAIAFFRGDSKEADQLEILRLIQLRAKVLRDAGAFTEAETDLRRGLGELERQRRGLQANDQRARFDAQMRGVQEDLLALLLDRGRTSTALELVESFSNRWWLESDLGSRLQPAPFSTSTIPPDTLVLRYSYTRNSLVIWMLQREGVEVIQLPASERRLWLTARMCREHDMASRRRERPFCDLTAAQLLPARVWALPLGARLVIVADHVSQEVPFAALRLRPSGPYLVERLRLALVPSVLHVSIERTREAGSGHAVFVADPALNHHFHPSLKPLYGAGEAAAAYARAYRAPVVLRGPAATRKAVLSAMATAELVHFEAHGFSVPGAPEAGGVVLAAEASASFDRGVLTAEDISRKHFRDLHLAVLAACQTSPRPYEDSVQLAGLATALIAAGATEVVTAAWDIDNTTAIRFFTAFHDCYSREGTGEDCLRNAQLDFLRSAESSLSDPRAWAPYQIYVASWNLPRASVSSAEGERHNESTTRRLARVTASGR
ncbi:MAG TPA: CHAT domain-containing protein, partial [Gemmatimonadales bacterium]|nr:CHAT domain-containing protein [Gemmatimonadales bacterium]